MKRAVIWSWVVCLAGGVTLAAATTAATAATDDAAERKRIAAERAMVEQRFSAAQGVCQTRFMVTDCLDRARAERRQAVDQLQRQTLLLDDAKRRERAALRLQAIQRRDAEAPPRQTAAPVAAPGAASASAAAGGKRPTRATPAATPRRHRRWPATPARSSAPCRP
jgi:hypothetical protein